MVCPNCGTALSGNSSFCGACGTWLVDDSKNANPIADAMQDVSVAVETSKKTDVNSEQPHTDEYGLPVYEGDYTQQDNSPAEENKTFQLPDIKLPDIKKIKMKKLDDKTKKILKIALPVTAGVIALIVLISVIVSVATRKTIDLNDYLNVSFSGYEGYGILSVDFDYEKFAEENNDHIKYIDSDYSYYENGPAAANFVYNYIDYDISGYEDLSNDDVVTVTWNVDSYYTYMFKINGDIKYDKNEIVVSGLESVETFDPFEYIDVSFVGTSPDGDINIKIDTDQQFMQYLNTSSDDDGSIANGDKVTVAVSFYSGAVSYIEKFGKLPSPVEKEFTVSGLDEYLGSISQLNDSDIADMKTAVEKETRTFLADNSADNEIYDEIEYVGCYLQTAKEYSYVSNENILTAVCRVKLHVDLENGTVNETYYHIVRYYNVSGNFSADNGSSELNLTGPSVASNKYYPESLDGSYYYYGYETIEALQKDLIENLLDDYSYEKNLIS